MDVMVILSSPEKKFEYPVLQPKNVNAATIISNYVNRNC